MSPLWREFIIELWGVLNVLASMRSDVKSVIVLPIVKISSRRTTIPSRRIWDSHIYGSSSPTTGAGSLGREDYIYLRFRFIVQFIVRPGLRIIKRLVNNFILYCTVRPSMDVVVHYSGVRQSRGIVGGQMASGGDSRWAGL